MGYADFVDLVKTMCVADVECPASIVFARLGIEMDSVEDISMPVVDEILQFPAQDGQYAIDVHFAFKGKGKSSCSMFGHGESLVVCVGRVMWVQDV